MVYKSKKIIALFLLIMIFFSIYCFPTYAYQLIGKKLIGGIRNRYYAFDSSVSGYWSTPFYNAINRWYNTNTYHAFAQSASASEAQVIFYTYSASDGNNGYTAFYSSSSTVPIDPSIYNWEYCKVYLNTLSLSSTTTDYDSGVACHELGHVCGLDENNSMPATIMCQAAYGRSVTTPQSDDCSGINFMYPNGY